jgi:hypothetical protein
VFNVKRRQLHTLVLLAALIGAVFFVADARELIVRVVQEPTIVHVEELGFTETRQYGIPVAAAYITMSDGSKHLVIGVWTGAEWDFAGYVIQEPAAPVAPRVNTGQEGV